MIESFRHKGLRRMWDDDDLSGLSSALVSRIGDVLVALDTAETIDFLRRPGFRLHELKGDRRGTWSITLSANWRITFRYEDGNVYDVDLIDYH
jgi:proteic killer suppression protein